MKRNLISLAVAAACAFAGSAQAQISDGIVKIGGHTDISGLVTALIVPGFVVAAEIAVEDYFGDSKSILSA